tara:strand:- start:84 stop:1232 length:1149 start_codon:yes stop_codon:yes gene_type:complete
MTEPLEESSPTLELTCALIRCQSITPADAGCQALLIARLEAMGFAIDRLPFENVENFWAIKGSAKPTLCFAGHTDVVPVGDSDTWQSPPFEPVLNNGLLYGRGAADMKGSLAAMITACEAFLKQYPAHQGSIAFLITSDEEGIATHGTTRVVDWLKAKGIVPEWCIVGEPSSSQKIGDTIKNGRRGSLNARLIVNGVQGHVAYPQLAENPIHRVAPILSALSLTEWDRGNRHFPATSFQISNIHAGTGATNVIPGNVVIDFNFRFSTEVTAPTLQARVESLLQAHGLSYNIIWQLSGEPFLTAPGTLVAAVTDSIHCHTGLSAELSTAGGTSDGRFIATLGTQVIELGPINATIHKIDENVAVADLETLREIYLGTLERLLT